MERYFLSWGKTITDCSFLGIFRKIQKIMVYSETQGDTLGKEIPMKMKKRLLAGLTCIMAIIVVGTIIASAAGELEKMDSYAEIEISVDWPENDPYNPDKLYVQLTGSANGMELVEEKIPITAEDESVWTRAAVTGCRTSR